MQSPAADKISYENPVTSFGFYGTSNNTESFLISKDGTHSNQQTTTDINKFTVTNFDQEATIIKKLKIHHRNVTSSTPGLLLGIELIDFSDKTIIKVGDWSY